MAKLTHRQHECLLTAIEEIHACRELSIFPATVNRLFLTLIRCDSVSYNEMVPAIARSVAEIEPPMPDFDRAMAHWVRVAHQHPVINYFRSSGDGSAHQISDFLTRQDYHSLELYVDFYRNLKVEHQLAIGINHLDNIVIGVALNRSKHSFSESHRLLANLLRPHIARAYLNLVELQHLEAQIDGLSRAHEEAQTAIILWSRREIILHASTLARNYLRHYFGWRDGRYLPSILADWARANLLDGNAPQIYLHEHDHSQLEARFSPQPKLHYTTILLREKTIRKPSTLLKTLGLSNREADVLTWLAEGKTNQEIAIILGMNILTVKTHLRAIFRKLSVENRTTAAARALELLHQSKG